MKRFVIFGVGGYGGTVDDIANQLNYTTTVLDDVDPAILLPNFTPISTPQPPSSLPLAITPFGCSG